MAEKIKDTMHFSWPQHDRSDVGVHQSAVALINRRTRP